MAPAEEQRRNYVDLGQIQKHADFDEERAGEAEEWVAQFIQDGRGIGPGRSASGIHGEARCRSIQADERMRSRSGRFNEEGSRASASNYVN